MITLVPIVVASAFVVASVLLGKLDFREARRRVSLLLAVSSGFCGLGWIAADSGLLPLLITVSGRQIEASASGFLGIVPVVTSLIGLVAVALSDSISHSVATLRRILLLLAIAMLFVAADEPLLLALGWGLSPLVVWLELRSHPRESGVARLFAIFHVPSVLLFGVTALVYSDGNFPLVAAAGLIAVGIREAVVPGHSWFVRFVEEAPMGLVVAFVAPQLGVYAHVELLGHGITPELASVVGSFGAITAVLAAALGTVQTSARRALAYLMMSQTGLVAFGLDGDSEVAFAGSLVAWQVLAVATSGLAMTLSALESRRGRLSLAGFSGCFSRTPRMAAGFLMLGLGSVGFPMTLGFIAEDLVVQGAVEHFPVLSFVLIVATALNGMTVMRAFFHLFSGRRVHTGESDLTNRESWALSAVLLILLVGGLVPSVITSREFTSLGDEVTLPQAKISRLNDSGSHERLPTFLPLDALDHPHAASILMGPGLDGR